MIKAALMAVLLVCTPPLWAQVYTWQDEQGRTHYSDQPRSDNAREEKVDIGAIPAPRQLPAVKTPVFDQSVQPPLIASPVYNEVLITNKALAFFYFGGDCVSSTGLNYESLQRRYPLSLPDANSLRRHLTAVLQRSFAGSVMALQDESVALMPDTNIPYLQGDIVDMRLHGCAQGARSSLQADPLSTYSLQRFDHSHAWVQVRWQLISRQTLQPLAEIITEGVGGRIDRGKSQMPDAMQNAFRDAAIRALADQHFASAIKQIPLGQQFSEPAVVSVQDRVLRDAKLTEVLVAMNQLRFFMAEYYAYHQQWPLTLEDIDQHSQSLAITGKVDTLELLHGGVLQASLKPSVFSGNHILQMIPTYSPELGQIHWDCRTTVENRLHTCQTFD